MLKAWTKSKWLSSGKTLVGVVFPVGDFSWWADGESSDDKDEVAELKEEGSERETERVFLGLMVVKSCLGLSLLISFMVET